MFVEEPAQERQPHDFQIEPHRPVLDVVQVVLDALLDRRVAAPAVDLRPAGDAGLHLVAQHVLRNLVLELLDKEWALGAWPDDRHVAAENIPELRQLVDVKAAEPAAEWRRTRIVVARPDRTGHILSVYEHCSELVNLEGFAVEAHALLFVERWSG